MSHLAPTKPCVALTFAVAGKRRIGAEALDGLIDGLKLVFHTAATRLESLHEGCAEDDPLMLRFSSDLASRLTLITGLADGADQTASKVFQATLAGFPGIAAVLGAVLPTNRADFVANSRIEDINGFEAAASACAFIVELDAPLPPQPTSAADQETQEDRAANRARDRAFIGQSEVLLRQADLLLAIDDPTDPGHAGGTRQTVRVALELGMPVLMLRIGRPGVAVLRTRADMDEPVPLPDNVARKAIWDLIGDMVGANAGERDIDYVRELLVEFYAEAVPGKGPIAGLWDAFEAPFKTSALFDGLMEPQIYDLYRYRASALSHHYASLYRGSFLLGYCLAVTAVALAVAALALLVLGSRIGMEEKTIKLALIGLASVKLIILWVIAWLGDRANHDRLAHRVADYRYLAERLRAMIFLPSVGALRPRRNWSLPYTTRVTAQGVIDQLFLSIVRQGSPFEAMPAPETGVSFAPSAIKALDFIRINWIRGQKSYHERNSHGQRKLSDFLQARGRELNFAVIGIVAVDLTITCLGWAGVLPHDLKGSFEIQAATLLIALAAVMPALVASLNGVRFQSECARLADRSEHMAAQLKALERKACEAKMRPTLLLDVLRLAEDVARSTTDEVAEWSAIYGKDFVEM